jgi:hypothetical protein
MFTMETVGVCSENQIISTSTLYEENAEFWSFSAIVVYKLLMERAGIDFCFH